MVLSRRVALALALSSVTFPSAFAGLVQKQDLIIPPEAAIHRAAVEKIFVTSYEAYKSVTLKPALNPVHPSLWIIFSLRKFAFGHDDLTPLSGGAYAYSWVVFSSLSDIHSSRV